MNKRMTNKTDFDSFCCSIDCGDQECEDCYAKKLYTSLSKFEDGESVEVKDKDINKTIEEMASDMDYACTKRDLYPSDAKEIAKALYLLGYRKPPEDSVIIPKKEYDDLVESKRQLGCYVEDQKIWISAAKGASRETKETIINIVKTICKEHNCLALAATIESEILKQFSSEVK